MNPLSYIVVSTPRSATRYIAKLFTELGLACSHEGLFAVDRQTFMSADSGIKGDSSWLAAPFLAKVPPETVIFHQIRDPIKTMNSMIHTSHFRRGGFYTRPFSRFVRIHTPFPPGMHSEDKLAIFFWDYWHRLIERNSIGKHYIRYRIEDLSTEFLHELLSRVTNVDLDSIGGALEKVARDDHHRGGHEQAVRYDMLPAAVRETVERYGYSTG
jgi:hypothetical protein